VGNAIYLKDHDSLEISNGLWNWHSQGIGGRTALDFLIKVRGYGFVDAVRRLAGESLSFAQPVIPRARPPTVFKQRERMPFSLPTRNADNGRVIAYLESRGIPRRLVDECINRNLLYESGDGWHNCVFLGADGKGKLRFAAIRGTRGDFKRDADGSDKRYGFAMPPGFDNDRREKAGDMLAVFESPIDAISHCVVEPDFCGWRLSLGGTSLPALTQFLEQHPKIRHCLVCTDNDEAGNRCAAKIAETLTITTTRAAPPNGAKDWNEALQRARNEVIEMQDARKEIRFINSDYKDLFNIRDGDSIKLTLHDGEEKALKCRFIDEAHIRLIGRFSNDYHICEFAERMERAGNRYEAIPNQKPTLNVLAAGYGEAWQHAEIPMTEAALKRLVGGKYETTPLDEHGYGVMLKGATGACVCGTADGSLTSLHPYWEQKYKRELAPVEPPAASADAKTARKPSLLGELEEAKSEARARNAASTPADGSRSPKQEIG
jgi:hypothetical protein